jgi:hypothetical protein
VFDSVGTAVASLQAAPERVDADPLDDLAVPGAVDLGLQVPLRPGDERSQVWVVQRGPNADRGEHLGKPGGDAGMHALGDQEPA